MKKKKLKLFSILFSAITMINNVFPTFAYDIDTEDNSIESIEYQNNEDIDFENSSNVFAQLGSEYKVIIPKVVVLSGASKDAKYFVKVEGAFKRREKCKSCNVYKYCNGGCNSDALLYGNLEDNYHNACIVNKAMFTYTADAFNKIIKGEKICNNKYIIKRLKEKYQF